MITPSLPRKSIAPSTFAPDNLVNNEIGWKTAWLDRSLQWNGDLYQEDWTHLWQVAASAAAPPAG